MPAKIGKQPSPGFSVRSLPGTGLVHQRNQKSRHASLRVCMTLLILLNTLCHSARVFPSASQTTPTYQTPLPSTKQAPLLFPSPPLPSKTAPVSYARTQDSLVSEPIRIMLGGSAANFAVHAANLNKAQPLTTAPTVTGGPAGVGAAAEDATTAAVPTSGEGVTAAAAGGYSHQKCLLHTSVASDTMGGFVRRELDEYGVEWSQTKAREHQVGLGSVLGLGAGGGLYSFVEPLASGVLASVSTRWRVLF